MSAGRSTRVVRSLPYSAMTGEFDWCFTLFGAKIVNTNGTGSIVMVVDD